MKKMAGAFLLLLLIIGCADGKRKDRANRTPIVQMEDQTTDSLGVPRNTGWVTDMVYVLTDEEIAQLDSIIGNYDKRTSVQIAILTFDSLWTTEEDFDKFNTRVLNAWGIGQKESNNGILMGICPEYRKLRITTGHGIEKVLNSSQINQIIDNDILPYLKNDEYYNGILNGVLKIIQALDAKNDSTIYRKNAS